MDFTTALAAQLISVRNLKYEDAAEAYAVGTGKVGNAVTVAVQHMTPAELGIIAAARQPSRPPRYGETSVAVRSPMRLNSDASGLNILLDLAEAALTDRIIDLVGLKEPIAVS